MFLVENECPLNHQDKAELNEHSPENNPGRIVVHYRMNRKNRMLPAGQKVDTIKHFLHREGKVREALGNKNTIEVETQNLDEVQEALDNNVDIIMLDNMSIDCIREAVKVIDGRAKVEISGGVNLESLEEISKTGADFVSVGALTHSAPAVDISMNIINSSETK